jgi:general stress protein CsbA
MPVYRSLQRSLPDFERVLIDLKIFQRTLIVGIVLQLALAAASHYVAYIARYYFLFGGMMISATAGYLYGMGSGKGYFSGATGGAVVGGLCALIGVGASVLMHDAARTAIPLFTAICVLTGAVGGLFGQMAAKLRSMGY